MQKGESLSLKKKSKQDKSDYIFSKDYRYAKLNGKEYFFGDTQARVIELLYDASQSHKPWVHSKTLLFESGSNAIRLRDLFKSQRNWTDVVCPTKKAIIV